MDRWLLLSLLCLLGLALCLLARRLRIEGARRREARAAYLDPLRPLLGALRARLEPSGFPRLAGRYQGRAVEFQAVPDALTFRKLPALWLMATLTEPQPLRGETRLMLRPSGLESFSAFGALPWEADPPPGFPEHARLRATAPGDLPPPGFLLGLAPLFRNPALKEVVLSPRGLRLVLLAEEAPRGAYLLFREAELARRPAPAATARAMLEALLAMSKDLAHAAGPSPRPDPARSDPGRSDSGQPHSSWSDPAQSDSGRPDSGQPHSGRSEPVPPARPDRVQPDRAQPARPEPFRPEPA